MKEVARQARSERRVAGLIPTMGALHAGHFSLVEAALREANPVIVSIFVNPKQFAPGEDYARYPRSMEADCEALAGMGVDVLFTPSSEEMYPPGFRTAVSIAGLEDRFEGRIRPGHFRGVATVVLKLLEITVPRFAYFGRKDAQQARLIRQMTHDLSLDSEIVICPIVREHDGLAMSSRNAYLSASERQAATVLYRALDTVCHEIAAGERQPARLVAAAREVLASEPLAKVDYLEIVDADSLEAIQFLRGKCLMLLAVRFGATRLIDNLSIEAQSRSETHRDKPGSEMETRDAVSVTCEL